MIRVLDKHLQHLRLTLAPGCGAALGSRERGVEGTFGQHSADCDAIISPQDIDDRIPHSVSFP